MKKPLAALQQPWYPWEEPQPDGPDSIVTLEEVLETPTLPGPGKASPSAVPNPYDMSGGGGSALSPSFSSAIGPQRSAFGWGPPDPPRHPQTQIKCNGLAINVDIEIAGIVELLNRSGISTLASCCAEENGYGFVMFQLDAAKKFLRFWMRSMKPQGWELPALSRLELRDELWRAWMTRHYPPPVPFDVDQHGHSYTTLWPFPSAQLPELRGPLCDALAQALRSRAGGRWSWAASLV